MKITFIGATHEVTGSCYYLEAAGHKFLVDCGMEQGPDYYENAEIPVALGEIEFVLLTHAHIDHSGNLPAIYAKGFRGPVYATDATSHLCDIMLRDSHFVQKRHIRYPSFFIVFFVVPPLFYPIRRRFAIEFRQIC